jgi:hypothetical protein
MTSCWLEKIHKNMKRLDLVSRNLRVLVRQSNTVDVPYQRRQAHESMVDQSWSCKRGDAILHECICLIHTPYRALIFPGNFELVDRRDNWNHGGAPVALRRLSKLSTGTIGIIMEYSRNTDIYGLHSGTDIYTVCKGRTE